MWIGTMKHNKTKILEFKSTKDPIKVLGAFLYYNPDKNFELNLLSRFKICGCQEISHFMVPANKLLETTLACGPSIPSTDESWS